MFAVSRAVLIRISVLLILASLVNWTFMFAALSRLRALSNHIYRAGVTVTATVPQTRRPISNTMVSTVSPSPVSHLPFQHAPFVPILRSAVYAVLTPASVCLP